MCRCFIIYICWINFLLVNCITSCWSLKINSNKFELFHGNASDHLNENNGKYNVIRLENADVRFGVFIDLKSELNFDESSTHDYIDLKNEPLFDLNGSAISIYLQKSLYQNSEAPRYICIRPRNVKEENVNKDSVISSCVRRCTILGIRAEGDRVVTASDGITEIPAYTKVTLLLFGTDFSAGYEIAFTVTPRARGSRCDNLPLIKVFGLSSENLKSDRIVKLDVSLPLISNGGNYYFCVRESSQSVTHWIHQGNEPWISVRCVGRILPIGLQALIICVLLVLSGLFSGLNLGLMALECTELLVLEKCGTDAEKKHARKIYPIRKKCNYLLCSLLLGNVLVNNTLTILLDELTSGMIAVALSTFGIVIFGEIIPQAICSRHGLAIGAKTLWITKLFMILTFPLSYPISRILDFVLGEEIRNVYNRKRLMEFIRVTKDYNDLHNEEVDIISGALELTKKTVADVMTKVNDVFMVPIDSVLNFETVSEIIKRGYSRIPVYDGDRNNIVSLLNIKDLAFVDPDTNTHLRTLCEFYNHPINYVFEDTTLDIMLNEFKKGRSHMAFVRRVNSDEDVDPFYELLGIVTLEDVIEEIIQSEIIDESDVLTDNRGKHIRKESQIRQDFSDFARLGIGDKKSTGISPQLALATYQYLSTSVEPFKKEYLSETVLKKLMSQDIFFKSKQGKDNLLSSSSILYQSGKSADYFILILEGRCHVTVGRENLVFETGPFSSFGLPAITINTSETSLCVGGNSPEKNPQFKVFIPDYTVVAVGETIYMKVHFAVYLSAYKATIMERQHRLEADSRTGSKTCSSQNSRGSSSDIPDEVP